MACLDGLSGQPSDLNESFSMAGREEVPEEVASRDRSELINHSIDSANETFVTGPRFG